MITCWVGGRPEGGGVAFGGEAGAEDGGGDREAVDNVGGEEPELRDHLVRRQRRRAQPPRHRQRQEKRCLHVHRYITGMSQVYHRYIRGTSQVYQRFKALRNVYGKISEGQHACPGKQVQWHIYLCCGSGMAENCQGQHAPPCVTTGYLQRC